MSSDVRDARGGILTRSRLSEAGLIWATLPRGLAVHWSVPGRSYMTPWFLVVFPPFC